MTTVKQTSSSTSTVTTPVLTSATSKPTISTIIDYSYSGGNLCFECENLNETTNNCMYSINSTEEYFEIL